MSQESYEPELEETNHESELERTMNDAETPLREALWLSSWIVR